MCLSAFEQIRSIEDWTWVRRGPSTVGCYQASQIQGQRRWLKSYGAVGKRFVFRTSVKWQQVNMDKNQLEKHSLYFFNFFVYISCLILIIIIVVLKCCSMLFESIYTALCVKNMTNTWFHHSIMASFLFMIAGGAYDTVLLRMCIFFTKLPVFQRK